MWAWSVYFHIQYLVFVMVIKKYKGFSHFWQTMMFVIFFISLKEKKWFIGHLFHSLNNFLQSFSFQKGLFWIFNWSKENAILECVAKTSQNANVKMKSYIVSHFWRMKAFLLYSMNNTRQKIIFCHKLPRQTDTHTSIILFENVQKFIKSNRRR